ncbi:MAG: LCP family protein [Candidatus Firestonebacteria bacterium]
MIFKIIKLLIIIVVLVFIVLLVWFKINKDMNVLILGVDSSDKYTHHADTIMLMSFNTKESKIIFVSIPRDTLVSFRGKNVKINEVYVYNFSKGGHKDASSKVTREVEKLLNISIPYYIQTNYDGVKEIVDLLGGARVKIEKKMCYEDKSCGLTINFKPGIYDLNGKKVIEYLRFRADNQADFGRIERHQKFLFTILNDCKKKLTIKEIPLIYKAIYKHMNTNISLDKAIFLFEKFNKFELNKSEKIVLPGEDIKINGIYFWKPDYHEIDEIVKKIR